jgi:cell wall-active antibiotic response 4TMS protein YvqF
VSDMTTSTTPASPPPVPPRRYWDRRRGYLLPMLLIAAGVFFLLGNLGYLPAFSWRAFVSLWPVLLILFGIELIVARREPLLALGLELLVIVAAVALVAAQPIGLLSPAPALGSTDFSRPRDQARSLSVRVDGGAGTYRIAGGASDLVDAHSSGGEIAVNDVRRGDRADIHVQPASMGEPFHFGGTPPNDVDLKIASDVPTSLRVSGGAGDFALDLTAIKVTDARVETGASRVELTLPTPTGDVPIRVSGGAATITIIVPDGVEAAITTSGGLLSTTTENPRLGSGTTSGVARSPTTQQTSGYATAKDRVTVTIQAGASSITIR